MVSYWLRTVRTGHGPAGDNNPSAVLKSSIFIFFRTGFVLSVLASAAFVLAEAARGNFDIEKLFVLASRTGSSMKQNPLV